MDLGIILVMLAHTEPLVDERCSAMAASGHRGSVYLVVPQIAINTDGSRQITQA